MKYNSLIRPLAAVLTPAYILATCISSYASFPSFPVVRGVHGQRLQLQYNRTRPRLLQENDELRTPSHVLLVPGNNSDWAGLIFRDKSGNNIEMQVSAGPTNADSEFAYPCRAGGNFQIAWRRGGRQQPCSPQGIQATRRRNSRRAQLPSSINISLLESVKHLLKAQASDNVGRYCSSVASSGGRFGWGSITSNKPWDFLSSDDPCEQAARLCQANSNGECSIESLGEWDIDEPDLTVSLVCADNKVFHSRGNGSQVRAILSQLAEQAASRRVGSCAISIYGSEDVMFAPDGSGETVIQTEDLGSRIATNVRKGNVFIRSAKNPEGFRLSEGQRYVYAGVNQPDKIENIDPRKIDGSPGMQAFLNPDNWLRSRPTDSPLSPTIANQLVELRNALVGGGQPVAGNSENPVGNQQNLTQNSQNNNQNQQSTLASAITNFPLYETVGVPTVNNVQPLTFSPDKSLVLGAGEKGRQPIFLASNNSAQQKMSLIQPSQPRFNQDYYLSKDRKSQIAQIPGINLPIPGGGRGIIRDAVYDQVGRQLARVLGAESPVIANIKDAYPTVNQPPGGAFAPSNANLQKFYQAVSSGNLTISLPPGDYSVGVHVFCMKHSAHAPGSSETFLLAPLKGKQAKAISALNSRFVPARIDRGAIQGLSWAIQAGTKYEELSRQQQAIVDRLIPEFKQQLSQTFWEKLQSISNTIPGAPSLDSIAGRLGPAGELLRTYQQARATIQQNGDNYSALERAFLLPGRASGGGDSRYTRGVWSKINDRIYARLLPTGLGSPGQLDIRILPPN